MYLYIVVPIITFDHAHTLARMICIHVCIIHNSQLIFQFTIIQLFNISQWIFLRISFIPKKKLWEVPISPTLFVPSLLVNTSFSQKSHSLIFHIEKNSSIVSSLDLRNQRCFPSCLSSECQFSENHFRSEELFIFPFLHRLKIIPAKHVSDFDFFQGLILPNGLICTT